MNYALSSAWLNQEAMESSGVPENRFSLKLMLFVMCHLGTCRLGDLPSQLICTAIWKLGIEQPSLMELQSSLPCLHHLPMSQAPFST